MPFEDQRAPSPPPSLTSIRAGRGEKNPTKPVGHQHLSIPALPALPALWKTSFISVQEWLLINNYALPSLYVSLSLSVSPLQPFLPHFLDGLPKEIKKNISFALPVWPECRSWKYNLWGLKKWRWHFVGIFVVNDLRKLLRGEQVRNKGNMMLWINVCMHVQNVCGRLTMNGTRKFLNLLP